MHLQEYFDPGTSTAIFRAMSYLSSMESVGSRLAILKDALLLFKFRKAPLAMTQQCAAGAHHSITQPKKYLRDRGELSLCHAHLRAYQPGALNGVFQLHSLGMTHLPTNSKCGVASQPGYLLRAGLTTEAYQKINSDSRIAIEATNRYHGLGSTQHDGAIPWTKEYRFSILVSLVLSSCL